MQSTLLHLEHARTIARETERVSEAARHRISHPPPGRRATRRRAAELLARVAWRLDREAALRVWP